MSELPQLLLPGTSALPRHRQGGFALILALSLMAFVLVLMVTLSSLVLVETSSTKTELDKLQAKTNARLSAMIALGDLQKALGPDMRVSAQASILSSDNPDGPDTGVSSFDAEEATRFWTGSWNSSNWDAGDPDDRKGRFQSWLVSLPDDLKSEIETVGDSALIALIANENNPDAVTLAKIQAVPFSGSTEMAETTVRVPVKAVDEVGRLAWWVSDEGVKVNPTLTDPYSGVTNPSDVEDGDFDPEIARFLFPHRPNLSLTDWFSNLDFNGAYGEELNERLRKISGLAGSTWLAYKAAESDIDSDVATVLQEDSVYADYSPYSHGVLSSTRRGGLRGDLSLAFWQDAGRRYPIIDPNDTSTETNKLFEENFRVRRIFSPIDYDDMTDGGGVVGDLNPFGPRWEALRDFHNSFQKITTDDDGYQVVRAAISDLDSNPNQSYHEQVRRDSDRENHPENRDDLLRRMGQTARDIDTDDSGRGSVDNSESLKSPVFPTLTRFIMEFQGTMIENPDQEPTIANGGTRDPSITPTTYRPEIRIALFVSLWNPYNVPISLANPNGFRGGGSSAIQGRMNIHFSPNDFDIFQIEINGEEWDVSGGTNNEITGDYDSLIPKSVYGPGRKGDLGTRTIGRFPYVMSDNRDEPLINSDFEAGEVRLFAIDGVTNDLMTAEYYDGSFARSLGNLTSYFTSVDDAGWTAFRNTFKKKLGFWDDDNAGFSAGDVVSFHLKINSPDDTPTFNTAFSGYSANASNQRPVTNLNTTIDLTVQPQQQAIGAASGDVVSLGYIEFILKSGNDTDPRN